MIKTEEKVSVVDMQLSGRVLVQHARGSEAHPHHFMLPPTKKMQKGKVGSKEEKLDLRAERTMTSARDRGLRCWA